MATCPSCEKAVNETARFCPFCGSQIAVVQSAGDDPYLGKLVAGKYSVEALLGEGGMGRVYKAVQQPLDKPVVLKVLKTALQGDASLVARFQREARAASRLSHPNSIQVTDFGQMEDGALYIAMEYLEGRDLAQELKEIGPFPQSRVVHVVGQILSALAEAHEAGVIHRDLKPENVMLVPRRDDPDHVKVLDFGIAKLQDGREGPDGAVLTQAGLVCGTPEYMSPEQARGEDLDPRSDLYAIGVLMYQLATGELPFQADTSIGIVTKHLTEDPVPPRQVRASISPDLESIILACMAKSPNARPASAEALRQTLKGITEQQRAGTAPYLGAAGAAGTPATEAPPPAPPAPPAAAASPPPADPASTSLVDHPALPRKRGRGGLWAALLVLPVLGVAGWALATGRLSTVLGDGGEGNGTGTPVADAGTDGAAPDGRDGSGDAPAVDGDTAPEGSGDRAAASAEPEPPPPAGDPEPGPDPAEAGAAEALAAGEAGDDATEAGEDAGPPAAAKTPAAKAPAVGRRTDPAPTSAPRRPAARQPPRKAVAERDTRPPVRGASRDPARARELAGQAERHWAQGDFEQALRLYEQAARHDPTEPTYQRQIGLANLSLGREARAMAPLRRYVQMAPNAADRPMIEALLREHGG